MPEDTPPRVKARERRRARRRLRNLRRLRDVQLRDAGGFVFDLFRFGERRDALVREKLNGLIDTDKEIRALEAMLDLRGRVGELSRPRIGGTCESCGAFHTTDARFCARCGTELRAAEPAGDQVVEAESVQATPAEPEDVEATPAEPEAAAGEEALESEVEEPAGEAPAEESTAQTPPAKEAAPGEDGGVTEESAPVENDAASENGTAVPPKPAEDVTVVRAA